MGEVYLAGDTRLGRKVALKVPPAKLLDQPMQLARFQREARALAAVNHPNVVTIYSVEEHEGLPFLTMELIEGKTLSELIPADGMSPDQILDVAVQLADGLAAAHEQGVLHRDLKPGNVMVGAEGRVTILDFGIAKRLSSPHETTALDETETLTQTGSVVGTVAYMAPEQIRGQPLDSRSDIFSLGIVLYQMATGIRPFRGSNTETMLAILEQSARPPSRVRSDLGSRFDEIVLRCLQKEPERRYPSARALRQDLAELRQTATGVRSSPKDLTLAPTEVAFPVREPERSRAGQSFATRGPWTLRTGIAGASLALFLTLSVWYAAQGSRHSAGTSPDAWLKVSAIAVLPLQDLSGEPEYFADGMTEALISSLGNLGGIRVISRQSVIRYKGSARPLPVIAKELGVDVVLTGSVTRSGGKLRVTAQLIRAEPEQQIWSAILTRDARDVLALQYDVAREVAREVRVELTDQEKARLADARPVDPAVYDLYLQGRFLWNKRTAEGLRLAAEYFKKALTADPTYAPAYAGLADASNLLGYLGYEPREPSFLKARDAALRALALDGSLAEAHASLGLVLMNADWNLEGAEHAFRKALDLNPSDVVAHQWLALDLIAAGRLDEAERHLNLALELNPFSGVAIGNLSAHALRMGDYDRALARARKVVELEPHLGMAREKLWQALHAKGRWAEAFKELEQVLSMRGSDETARHAARAYATSGYRAALLAASRHLEKNRPESRDDWLIAETAALAGDRKRAISLLTKAVEHRDPYVLWLGQMWQWNGLRGDPRFEALVRRVHARAAEAARRSGTPASS